jgi:hypothetical protein
VKLGITKFRATSKQTVRVRAELAHGNTGNDEMNTLLDSQRDGKASGQASVSVSSSVYIFADHLDAALAHGEDLLALTFTQAPRDAPQSADAIVKSVAQLKTFVASVRRREMALTLRVLQLHRRLDGVLAEPSLRTVAGIAPALSLFRAATGPLATASLRLADGHVDALDTGHDLVAFLKSRHLLEPDAVAIDDHATLTVSADYPVAGALPLGPLLDVVARTLDVLDAAFGLYSDDDFIVQKPQVATAVRVDSITRVSRAAPLPLSDAPSPSQSTAGNDHADATPVERADPMSASDMALASAVALATSAGQETAAA